MREVERRERLKKGGGIRGARREGEGDGENKC